MINRSEFEQYTIKNQIISIIYQAIKYPESRPNANYEASEGKLAKVLDMTRVFGDDWSHMNERIFVNGTPEGNYRSFVRTKPNTTVDLLKMLALQIKLLDETQADRYHLAREWVLSPMSLTESIQGVMRNLMIPMYRALEEEPEHLSYSSSQEEKVASVHAHLKSSIKVGLSRLMDCNSELVYINECIGELRYAALFEPIYEKIKMLSNESDENVIKRKTIKCLDTIFRTRLKMKIVSEYRKPDKTYDHSRVMFDASTYGIQCEGVVTDEYLVMQVADKRLENIKTILDEGILSIEQKASKENTLFHNQRINTVYNTIDKYIDTASLATAIMFAKSEEEVKQMDINLYVMPDLSDSSFIDYAKSRVDALYEMLVLQNKSSDGFSLATYVLETNLTEIRARPWTHRAAVEMDGAVGILSAVFDAEGVDYALVLRLAVLDAQKRFIDNYMLKMNALPDMYKSDLMKAVHADLMLALEKYRNVEKVLLKNLSGDVVDINAAQVSIKSLSDMAEKMHGLHVVSEFRFENALPLKIPRGEQQLSAKELIMLGFVNQTLEVLNNGLDKIEGKILNKARSSAVHSSDDEKMAQWAARYVGVVEVIKELHKKGKTITAVRPRDKEYPIVDKLNEVIALLEGLVALNKETKKDSTGVEAINTAIAAVKDMRSEFRSSLEAMVKELVQKRDQCIKNEQIHASNVVKSSGSPVSGNSVVSFAGPSSAGQASVISRVVSKFKQNGGNKD